jgi:hypothetical protein
MNALGQLPGALWHAAVGFSGDTPGRCALILCTSRKRPPLAYDEGERLAIRGARMMKRAGPQLGVGSAPYPVDGESAALSRHAAWFTFGKDAAVSD